MSNFSNLFHAVPVEIQNRSGADLSHQHLTTLRCGTLTPMISEFLMPGDKISLGSSVNVDFPPMVTNFFGKVDICQEAFFVPLRILWGGYKDWFTYKVSGSRQQAFDKLPKLPRAIAPFAYVDDDSEPILIGHGQLWDYLGNSMTTAEFEVATAKELIPKVAGINMFLPLAYYKIWDDWYRDSLLQVECFNNSYSDTSSTYTIEDEDSSVDIICASPANIPSASYDYLMNCEFASNPNGDYLGNGVIFGSLMQRNYYKDYFTTATTLPQYGAEASLKFSVSGGSGEFTIAALRAANSLQQFVERNNLSAKYEDQIYNRFGVKPADAVIDHPIYLGSSRNPVLGRSVVQSAPTPSGVTPGNPFSTVGASYGKVSSLASDSLVNNFEATEPGVFMVLMSVVPHAMYNSGVRRNTQYDRVTDFPDPMLARIGDQTILGNELYENTEDFSAFGYTQRYAEAKFINDRVTGLMRDGDTLGAFALQRGFSSNPELGSSFLEIPVNALDSVMAVNVDNTGFTAWVDAYYEFHKSSVLPAYSIPTLGDPQDTHTVMTSKGGTRL